MNNKWVAVFLVIIHTFVYTRWFIVGILLIYYCWFSYISRSSSTWFLWCAAVDLRSRSAFEIEFHEIPTSCKQQTPTMCAFEEHDTKVYISLSTGYSTVNPTHPIQNSSYNTIWTMKYMLNVHRQFYEPTKFSEHMQSFVNML